MQPAEPVYVPPIIQTPQAVKQPVQDPEPMFQRPQFNRPAEREQPVEPVYTPPPAPHFMPSQPKAPQYDPNPPRPAEEPEEELDVPTFIRRKLK